MTKCSVKKCNNNRSRVQKKDGVSYHQFPANEIMREKWRKIIAHDRDEEFFKPNSFSVVCSDHFLDSDMYYTKKGYRKIKTDTLPKKGLQDLQIVYDVFQLPIQGLYVLMLYSQRPPVTFSSLAKRKHMVIATEEFWSSTSMEKSKDVGGALDKSQSRKKKNEKAKQKQYDPFEEFANTSTDEDSTDTKQETSDEAEPSDDDESEIRAPVIENVFIKPIAYKNKQSEDGQVPSKRARSESTELPLDYREQLYEFGKYVAEQLLCLDVEDARVAQAEITAVLSKFNIDQLMHCKVEPSTSNVHPETDGHCSSVVTPKEPQVNPVVCLVTQSGFKVNTAEPSVTQSVFTHVNTAGLSVTESSSQVNTAGPSATQSVFTHVNTAGSPVTQSVFTHVNTAAASVTQSGSQVNTGGPSATQSVFTHVNTAGSPVTQFVFPHMSTAGPSGYKTLTEIAASNVNPSASSTAPDSFIIVPTETGSVFNKTTELENVEKTLVTSGPGTSVGSVVTQSESLHMISAGTSMTQPGSSSTFFTETSAVKTEPEELGSSHSHVNVMMPSERNAETVVFKFEPGSEDET